MANDPPVPAYVHGVRNKAAVFAGGSAGIVIGGLSGPSYASDQGCVLLTVEGIDKTSAEYVDIEIAVPYEHIPRLVELLLDRARI